MQHRNKLILEFWDRSKELNIKNNEYRNFVDKFLSILLKNDIKNNDLTTNSLIKTNKNVSAMIVAKEDGVFAGFEEFTLLNKDLKIEQLKNNGDKIRIGDMLVKISGDARKILERERTSLNLLQRMSGIATLTNSLNEKLNDRIKIAATRKTLWGVIDKKAVSIGGGLTHRLNLNGGIIIKDNHLKIFNHSIEKALKITKNKSKYIEIEVGNKKQALDSAKAIKKSIENNKSNNKNLFAIMLDNINPKKVKSIINELKNDNLYDYVLLEASGNINYNNIEEYADCGVDVISMGCITNSAKILNMSMEIK